MKHARYLCLTVTALFCLIAGGCKTFSRPAEKTHFVRFFNWSAPRNPQEAQRFADIGVTDVVVNSKKSYELVKKFGMTPYWKCFTPAGPHLQVLLPEENKYQAYISGADLDPKMPRAKRNEILNKRKNEVQHRWGGEMVTSIDVLAKSIPCFLSDDNLVLSRKKIDNILKDAPQDVAGIFLDFFGYTNHNGCYCAKCLAKYRTYLSERKLADTPENKVLFYREKLIGYYDAVINYIKSKKPHYKIVVHIYPDFKADPLYGNRVKAEFCGQTVAWYFQWNQEKIKKYTAVTVNRARDHHSFAQGIPFLGLNTDKTSSLGYKTPADVERELKTILSAGGDTIMICCGRTIIEEGYYEVFKKYCGKR